MKMVFGARLRTAVEAPVVQLFTAIFFTIVIGVIIAMRHDVRWLLVFAWPCAIIVVWEFARIYSLRQFWTKFVTFFGAAVLGAGLFCLYVVLAPIDLPSLLPTQTADACAKGKIDDQVRAQEESFEQAVLAGADKPLGSAHCWSLVQRASTTGFERAVTIWIVNPIKGFFLLQNFNSKRWEFHPETLECDKPWCDAETKIRAQFFQSLFGTIPTGEYPPFGAMGRFLSENRDRFKDIGWEEWDCEITNPTFYQQFDHARALGVYPNSFQNRGARITILYDDDSYQILNPLGLNAAPCVNDGLRDHPGQPRAIQGTQAPTEKTQP